jgi:hypothetical protein
MKTTTARAKAAMRARISGATAENGYVPSLIDNLLPNIHPEQFIADLNQGSGNELGKKSRAVHSSSALGVNCFAHFKDAPGGLQILGKRGATAIRIEGKLKIFPDRNPANLDVWIEMDREIVAIESKLLEYFDPTVPEFADAYE